MPHGNQTDAANVASNPATLYPFASANRLSLTQSRIGCRDYRAINTLLKSRIMARITVEDCLKNVDNQFDLVLVAAKRARRLANGADPLVERENDKPTVIALREIAEGLINAEILEQMALPEEDILSSEEAEELLASTPLPGANMMAAPVIPPAAAQAKVETSPDTSAAPAINAPADAATKPPTDGDN